MNTKRTASHLSRGLWVGFFLIWMTVDSYQAQSAPAPILIKVIDANGVPMLGELTAESEESVELIDLKTGKKVTFQKSALNDLRKGISEKEAANTIGLAEFLVWRIRRVLPGSLLSGKIVLIDPPAIHVMLGSQSGIEKGQELLVYRGEAEIKNPDTGEVLGTQRRRIARLSVIEAWEKHSKATLLGDLDVKFEIGDIVEPASQSKPIAVLPLVDLNGCVRSGGKKLGEDLTTGLVQGGISIVERTLLPEVLVELGLQNTKVFDAGAAQKIGRQLGAYAILTGTLTPSGNKSDANIRLIKVETGEVLFASPLNGPSLGGIITCGSEAIIIPSDPTNPLTVIPPVPSASNFNRTAPTSGTAIAGWERLFNGKDLDGWDGDPNAWSVQDGAITGDNIDSRRTTFLVYRRRSPGDFELSLRARLIQGNSGIQFRSRVFSDWLVNGYQMEITENSWKYFGGLSYEGKGHVDSKVLIPRNTRASWPKVGHIQIIGETGAPIDKLRTAVEEGGWNTYTITAFSNRMILRINGLTTVDFTDNHPMYSALSGVIALQLHWWNGQNTKIQFKDIFIRTLPTPTVPVASSRPMTSSSLWQPLFNGRDLSGWTHRNPQTLAPWQVQNGALSGHGFGNTPMNDIYTVQNFWNFTFKCEFKIAKGGNSGVYLRGRHEIAIVDDDNRGSHAPTGTLYTKVGGIEPSRPAFRSSEQWQTMEATMIGNKVSVTLNGLKIHDNVEWNEATRDPYSLDTKVQASGPILLQGHTGDVQFRYIQIKEIK